MKDTLNLLPLEIGVTAVKRRSLFYYILIGVGAYSALIIGLWIFDIIEVKKLDNRINRLTQQKTELQQKILPPSPVTAPVSIDKEILDAIGKAPKWSHIVSELSVIVPDNVWLSSIESKEDKGIEQLTIKGFSTAQLGVANLISALEASEYFYAVEIVFSQKGEKEIAFELRAKLKWT